MAAGLETMAAGPSTVSFASRYFPQDDTAETGSLTAPFDTARNTENARQQREARENSSRLVAMSALLTNNGFSSGDLPEDNHQQMIDALQDRLRFAQNTTIGGQRLADMEITVQQIDPETGQTVNVRMTYGQMLSESIAYHQSQLSGYQLAGSPQTWAGGPLIQEVSAAGLDGFGDMDRLTYRFGGKSERGSGIDCSGFIARIGDRVGLNLNVGAAEQIRALERLNGESALRIDRNTGYENLYGGSVHEGMVIGIDTGSNGWDRGRYQGIDHIVMTVRGQDGGLYVIESTSARGDDGRNGVQMTRFNDWAREAQDRGWELHVTDLTGAVAASRGLDAGTQTQVAAARPAPAGMA